MDKSAHFMSQLHPILLKVQKPGRYTGGELNQVVKNWDQVTTHICLVFPDIYDIGMSNLGIAILYHLINQRQDALAERAFSPWLDMEAQLREHKIPLFSLENKQPLKLFDIIGFSLAYESLYTNVLNILDLSGIPILSSSRTEDSPLIIAGGHAAYNPEPMHAFIDAFVIGEGEEVIHEIIDAYVEWKKTEKNKQSLLESLASIPGIYVPKFYNVSYLPNGKINSIEPKFSSAPNIITKRIIPILPKPPTKFIVPYIDTVHNRIPIEIMRGCTRGCRFCQAGMVTRPVRERTVEEILKAIEESLDNTGYEEVGLLSLSSSDYSKILELVEQISNRYTSVNLSVSIPSLRIETLSVDLMDKLTLAKRGGFTLAPEAASERMRRVINKPVESEMLLAIANEIYSRGWPTIKLYFMIGHPTETLDDVAKIVDLCNAVLRIGKKHLGGRAQVHAGISTFIPKPHTPFQWVSLDSIQAITEKQSYLKREMRNKGLRITWNSPEDTILEAMLTRGDRRLSDVIYEAWKSGAKFDAWNDQFQFKLWQDALKSVNLDYSFFTHRLRTADEIFPWEHIDIAVKKKFLYEEFQRSTREETLADCRDQCYGCGILQSYLEIRRNYPVETWFCPEIPPNSS